MEWRLYPLDVLFFRGMDPMNTGEHGAVTGVFPPAPEVLQGLVRTVAAEHAATTPDARRDVAHTLATTISLTGPYLIVEKDSGNIERWYPAPLDLWREDGQSRWRPGTLGAAVQTDLGRVRLLTNKPGGADRWIRHDGLENYLKGESVPASAVAHCAAFWEMEPRTGIARDATTRAVKEGQLYAPAYVRLRWRDDLRDGPKHGAPPVTSTARVGIGVRVSGLEAHHIDERALSGLVHFGGEGRTAQLEVHEPATTLFPKSPVAEGAKTIRMVLLSPAHWRLSGSLADSWLPPGFTAGPAGETAVWNGTLGRKPVTLAGAVTGKPVRIGGWDINKHRSKDARACIPAGSVYFLHTPAGAPHIHGQNINGNHADNGEPGESGRRFGYGWTLTGNWKDSQGEQA